MKKSIYLFVPVLFFIYIVYLLLQGYLPMGLDIVTGVYFPWLNNHYLGLSTWTPVHNPSMSDITSQAVVWRAFISDHLLIPSSLWWNNLSLAGYPFLGSSYLAPIFHPLNFLLLLGPKIGISLQFILQIPAVYLAAIFLFSGLEMSFAITSIFSIAFTLGGLSSTWFELGSYSYVLAMTLFICGLVIRYLKTNRKLWLFMMAPATSLLIIVGHYQIVMYGVLSIAIFSLLNIHSTHDKYLSLFNMATQALIGVMLCGLVIIPTYFTYNQSIREEDKFISQQNYGLIPYNNLKNVLNPDYFGNPSTYNYRLEEVDYQEHSSYLGIILIPIILSGLLIVSTKKHLYWYVPIGLLFLALITSNPVSQYLMSSSIPIISSSKASRFIFLYSFFVLVGGAQILNSIRTKKEYILLSILQLIVGAILSLFVYLEYSKLGITAVTTSIIRTSLVPIAMSIFMAFCWILKSRFSKFPVLLILSILLTFDLGRYFFKFNTFSSQEIYYPVTEEFAFLQDQASKSLFRTEYYGTAGVPMNIWEAYGLESASGYTSIYPKRYGEFIGIVNDDKINTHPGRFVHIFRPQSPLFDLLNIKYVLVNFSDCPDGNGNNIVCQVVSDKKYKQVFLKDNMAIFENTSVLPRFFFPKNYLVATSDQDIVSTLSNHSFIPAETIVLEKDPSLLSPLGSGSIQVEKYSSTDIRLNYTSSVPNLLYIGNTFDRGWSASVDGQKVEVLRANYTFAAAQVPAGSHQLILRYTPPLMWQGIAVSILGLVLYILSLIIYKKKNFLL